MAAIHEVFPLSGEPTYTYVEPDRYYEIAVSLNTPGRCMVLEGPSGIGKSTLISRALSDLRVDCIKYSARDPRHIPLISQLPNNENAGTVIIDDFHRLPDEIRVKISDLMKVLADTQDPSRKLIIIGINKAGQQLINSSHDLGLRLDIFKLESNSHDKILQLLRLGEETLNIEIEHKEDIASRAEGSFQIVQLLAHKLCIKNQVIATCTNKRKLNDSISVIIESVMTDLSRIFKDVAVTFARGSKLRREGRAPYLHILKWLSLGDEWSIDLREALTRFPDHKQSIGQVLDKGYLQSLLNEPEKKEILEPYFHFEPSTGILSVEDPRLVFYLKNLVWRAFTRQVGYRTDYFKGRYDFALSFAGPQRAHAHRIKEILQEREIQVFYDYDEQSRIIARNVEDYLAPIYRSEAKYVVALMSTDYPHRIWAKFESDQFKERFGLETLIPIRYTNSTPGWFSDEQYYGSLSVDPNCTPEDLEKQLQEICNILAERLIHDRQETVQLDLEETGPSID